MSKLSVTVNLTETEAFKKVLEVIKLLMLNVNEDIRQQAKEKLLHLGIKNN